MLVLLAACLFDRATYEARLRELSDADGDGVPAETDCDDDDATVAPGLAERCDGQDQDCDGQVDEDATDAPTWYNDADHDGHGLAAAPTRACAAPAGHVADPDDCDDGNAARNPGAAEVAYDGVDQDCSGADLVDVDGDGFAALAAGGADCDDGDDGVAPDAAETWADGFVDNDCDGVAVGAAVEEFDEPRWRGARDGGQLGYTMAALGDLDGDGTDEVCLGALFDDLAGEYAGRAWIVGPATAADLSDAPSLVPDVERSFLGVATAAGRDNNGDGHRELAIAGDGHDGGRGAVWLLDGAAWTPGAEVSVATAAHATISGDTASTYLGHSIAVLTDFAGDGHDVLAVGVPSATTTDGAEAGRALLFDWELSGQHGPADALGGAEGYYPGAQLGVGLEAGPDVDGDGLPDWLVRFSAGDIAAVLPGGVVEPSVLDDALVRLTGSGAGETADCSFVGDVDGSGSRDVVCAEATGFRVYTHLVLASVMTPEDADLVVSAAGEVGRAKVDLGDRDGDGRAETWLTTTDGPGASAHGAVLPGSLADLGGTVSLTALALLAAPDTTDSRYGFTSLLLADEGADQEWLLIGGPSRDDGGPDRGAVAALALPR